MASKEWLITGLTGLLSVLLWQARGRAPLPGDVVEGAITIVPLDHGRLGCTRSAPVGQYRCAYRDERTPWMPPPEPEDTLAPYVTTDRIVYLVPGLFEVASVRIFAGRHPADFRFTARCTLRLVEKVSDFGLRFRPEDAWHRADGPSWVAVPVSCDPA